METETTTDLMIKRIKVIGDYPYNKYHKLGSIYTDDLKNAVLDDNKNAVCVCDWEKYPFVFEILPWYAERKVEDMPEFLKWNYMPNVDDPSIKGYIQFVEKWTRSGYGVKVNAQLESATKNWIPGTKDEYLAYHKITEQEYSEYQKQSKK